MVTSTSANKRERRKETRTEVDACAKMAHDLLNAARDYYTKDAKNEATPALGAKIRFEIQRLTIRAERLQSKRPEFDISNAVIELYESLTGDTFDSRERVAVEFNSSLLVKIESDVHFLIDQLEEGFHRAYP